MADWIWMVIPIVFGMIVMSYFIYVISTRGLKGLLFVPAITETFDDGIEYRIRGQKHTIRIHKLTAANRFGIEIGRWTGIFGETTGVEIPREELVQLQQLVMLALSETQASEFETDGR